MKHPTDYTLRCNTIQRHRYNNWARHYEIRALFRISFSPETMKALREMTKRVISIPQLDVLGRAPQPNQFIQAHASAILGQPENQYLFNPWYWTQGGWDEFVVQWQSLPEPEELWTTDHKLWNNLWITCG